MTNITRESFYNSKLHQYALSFEVLDEKQSKKKKLKQLSEKPLEESVFQQGLKNIGKTPSGSTYAYLSLELQGVGIATIYGVEKYMYLQHMDVSNNNIVSLKSITELKYLTYLKAANNNITRIDDFKPPYCLEFLDLSSNQITSMCDLSGHRFLRRLYLNNNGITTIEGIEKNRYLEILSLSQNKIEEITNLDDLNLVELNLFGNNIRFISGLERLPKLRTLDLSKNHIKKLHGLRDLLDLRKLYLTGNRISKIRDLIPLEHLSFLSDLDLCFNPLQSKKYYRLQVLFKLSQIRSLDGVMVTPEESVKAENLYGMELEDKQRIFHQLLPEEDFIDRRIHRAEFIDPETESDEENIDFVDKYDSKGNPINKTQSQRQLLNSQRRLLDNETSQNTLTNIINTSIGGSKQLMFLMNSTGKSSGSNGSPRVPKD